MNVTNDLPVDLGIYHREHGLTLPDWGPYSPYYAGISHVADKERGMLFDVPVSLGHYSRPGVLPDACCPNGHHSWDANRELSYYRYRYELEWKDVVYADVSFFAVDATSRLLKVTFHNNKDYSLPFQMELPMGFVFPEADQGCEHVEALPVLEPGETWIDADDYRELSSETRAIPDGFRRGVRRDTRCVRSKALGSIFPLRDGDAVVYAFDLPDAMADATITVRYSLALEEQDTLPFMLDVDGQTADFRLIPSDNRRLEFLPVRLGRLARGAHVLTMTYTGPPLTHHRHYVHPVDLVIDGFLVAPTDAGPDIPSRVVTTRTHPTLAVSKPDANSLLVRPNLLDRWYGVVSMDYPARSWELLDSDRDRVRKWTYVAPFQKANLGPLVGNRRNHFAVLNIAPITCPAGASVTCYAAIGCADSDADLYGQLGNVLESRREIETRVMERHQGLRYHATGSPYAFSQERMMSHVLMNVYAPQQRLGEYIKSFPPAKAFGGLYSWDAGFTGLGVLECSPKLALETMNTYFTEPENAEIPYIFHGTPLPVQIYLLWESYQRLLRRDVLEHFYPKARRFYQFTVREFDVFGSGLLTGRRHFYSPGGMDDYPAVVHVEAHDLGLQVSPVILTAHYARAAKLLRLMAAELGEHDDVAAYGHDIDHLSGALLRYGWHEESGYFAFVSNADKRPLLYKEQVNFNMGFDGVSPLVADIGDAGQIERMTGHLKNPNALWSRYGLTAVSQSSPYYRTDGYWNGRVWMPHQWFFWKAMIGLGELEFAEQIARTALDLWERETQRTYNQWESFMADSGHGVGISQFGALSCPVLNFHAAYYQPGTVTVGYDVVLSNRAFDAASGRLSVSLHAPYRNGATGVIAAMGEAGDYRVGIDGSPYATQQTDSGAIAVGLTLSEKAVRLTIERKR